MAQRSGINRGLMWLRKTLEITEETDSPQVLGETLRPVIDVFGWDVPEYEFITNLEAGATSVTRLAAVPEGEAHLFLAATIFHDDGVGSKDMSLQLENIQGDQVALTQTVGLTASFFIAMPRPMLLRAGSRLIGISRNAIAGGSFFIIRGMFLRLVPGEYLAASPFG